MEVLKYHSRPALRRPILVAGFRSGSWLDSGEAASGAAQYLRMVWNTRPLATVDPEEFYDFTVVRPTARMVDGKRETVWPTLDFWAGEIPGTNRDAIVLTGVEPSTRWKTFRDTVMTVVHDTGVEVLVTLGSLPANVPHTRPPRILGIAFDEEMQRRYGLQPSTYQGPTGITSVLAEAVRAVDIPAIYLVAMIPHYVQNGPSPNAILALLQAMSRLADVPVDTHPLTEQIVAYHERVQRQVDADPDVARYVRMLEQQLDQQTIELPTAEELGQQFEEFLREQPGESDS